MLEFLRAGLRLIGVPAPSALASLAFLAEFAPLIGPIAAAIPALLLALVQGWGRRSGVRLRLQPTQHQGSRSKAPHRRAFPIELHRQRPHAGSAFGQQKRRPGSALTAHGDAAQQIELGPRVLAHNLALLAVAAREFQKA